MKIKLLSIFAVFAFATTGQWGTDDVVSIGAGYTNQVWYSLENDEQGTAPKNEWDLAFEINGGQYASIRVNHPNDVKVWSYPNGDTADWSSLDTAGITGWTELYNSDTSWSYGAFNRDTDFNNFNLGWGFYNMTTHAVVGDSLFVIKLNNGDYKKLWIESLAAGVYSFRYADLDNSNDNSVTIDKANYPNRNFAYHSIQNQQTLDREPNDYSWDLLFTQYGYKFPGMNYFMSVTGILLNKGTTAAVAYPVNDSSTYENFNGLPFSTSISTIGYDWKSYGGGGYTIEDSTVYFVKTVDGDYWKMVFTGFGGSATGDMEFTKKKLGSANIGSFEHQSFVKVYPNPAVTSSNINIVLDQNFAESVAINFIDLSGRIVKQSSIQVTPGLQTYSLQAPAQKGQYIVQLQGKEIQHTSKIIIQ